MYKITLNLILYDVDEEITELGNNLFSEYSYWYSCNINDVCPYNFFKEKDMLY